MNDRTAEPNAHDHGDHDHRHGHEHGPTCAHTSDGSEDGDSAVDLGDGRHRFRVSGMDCASCANTISTAIGGLPGVSDIKVSVAREMMTLALDETRTSAATIEEKVRGLGYGVERAPFPRSSR